VDRSTFPAPDDRELAAEVIERSRDVAYRYRLDPPGFDYVSPAVTEVTGYTPEEHYADPELGLKIVHPEDFQRLRGVIESVPDGSPLILRWIAKDGRVLWTEQRNVPVFDDEGRLVAIDGVAREISGPRDPAGTLSVGGLVIDRLQQHVLVDSSPVHVTPAEFRILRFLAERADVVSREEIVRELWESEFAATGRACEVHISNLRRKVERDPRRPERILTVRGRGYRLVAA
jgi:PAS domain S-box-containing protein